MSRTPRVHTGTYNDGRSARWVEISVPLQLGLRDLTTALASWWAHEGSTEEDAELPNISSPSVLTRRVRAQYAEWGTSNIWRWDENFPGDSTEVEQWARKTVLTLFPALKEDDQQ